MNRKDAIIYAIAAIGASRLLSRNRQAIKALRLLVKELVDEQ